MDPITALGVASSVIQVVDYGTRAVKRCFEIYKSSEGLPGDLLTAEEISRDLTSLVSNLQSSLTAATSSTKLSQDDQALSDLAKRCATTADRLLRLVDKLKVTGSYRLLKSAKRAIGLDLMKREVDNIYEEMQKYRTALNQRLLIKLGTRLDTANIQQAQSFSQLDSRVQTLVQSIEENKDAFAHQNETLEQLHTITQRHVSKENESTKELIQQLLNELQAMQRRDQHRHVDYDDGEVRRKLCETLYFAEHCKRQGEVADAHRETFRWIFTDKANTPRRGLTFGQWLEEGEGMFFIKGKPGSGKSTLMNFICQSPETRLCLKRWCGSVELVFCQFFCWNSGSTLQKSQIGLIRSLIFQILQQQPWLIRLCFPDRSEVLRVLDQTVANGTLIYWTERRLKETLSMLVTRMDSTIRVFLLLDGLDELEADRAELIEFLDDITVGGVVKVCVSTRELAELEDILSKGPQLRLQDLTYDDISWYINDKLSSNAHFQTLQARNKWEARELTTEITEKSAGVFLWTKLVVNSVLGGLRNRDTLSELRSRVKTLSSELEKLYERLLQMLEEDTPYFQEASKIFQIAAIPSFGFYWERDLCLLDLVIALKVDLEVVLSTPIALSPHDALVEMCEDGEAYLRSHTMSLLEIILLDRRYPKLYEGGQVLQEGFSQDTSYSTPSSQTSEEEETPWEPFMDWSVVFLHRTAGEFLQKPENWNRILRATAKLDFNPDLALFMSFLTQMKTCAISREDLCILVMKALACAHRAEAKGKEVPELLLDELNRVGELLLRKETEDNCLEARFWPIVVHSDSYLVECEPRDSKVDFLSMAAQAGLTLYVDRKLRSLNSEQSRSDEATLLLYNCFQNSVRTVEYSCFCDFSAPMVGVLLKRGANPNKDNDGVCAWVLFLHKMFERSQMLGIIEHSEMKKYGWSESPFLQILMMLFFHKVDPHSTIKRHVKPRNYSEKKEDTPAYIAEVTAYAVFAMAHGSDVPGYAAVNEHFAASNAQKSTRDISIDSIAPNTSWRPYEQQPSLLWFGSNDSDRVFDQIPGKT